MKKHVPAAGPPAPPRSLRWAIRVLYFYAAYVLLVATIDQTMTHWVDWASYPRGVLQSFIAALLAARLGRGERWAWFVSMGLGALWIVLGGVAVTVLMVLESEALASGQSRFSISRIVVGGFAYAMVFAVVLLLLQRDTRAVFRKRWS